MSKPKRTYLPNLEHSYSEANGRGGTMTFTACCECERGGNGSAEHKCSCGGLCTEWDKLGCWAGTPVAKTAVKDENEKVSNRRASIVNRCQCCNFEIDSGLEFCDFCLLSLDEPLPIKLTKLGLSEVRIG